MKWRDANDFPDETGEQLVEVEQGPNDPGAMGARTIYPTYVRFIKRDNWWMNPPEGYKVKRWLDESPTVSGWSDEDMVKAYEKGYNAGQSNMSRQYGDYHEISDGERWLKTYKK